MNVAISVVQAMALVLIGLYLLSLVSGHLDSWRYFSRYNRSYPSIDYAPPVSIVKPNRGLEPWTRENFRSYCEQVYPGDYEIIFCVQEPSDPSVPVVRELIAEYPQRQIRLVFSDSLETKAAGKLRNLIAGVAASRYDVLLLSDSDVCVDADFVRWAVEPMSNPKVGLAYAVPTYAGAQDWTAAMLHIAVNNAVLHSGSTAFRNRINAAVGSTMVMRRDVLGAISGLESIGDRVVGIDISISRAVVGKGYAIHLLGEPVRLTHPHSTFAQWWWQVHRWMVTIRSYYPAAVPLTLLLGIPLWWALVFAVLHIASGGNIWIGVLPVIVVIAARLLSAIVINLKLVHDSRLWRYLWVIPVMDVLTLPLMIQSALSDRVLWSGRWIRVRPGSAAEKKRREKITGSGRTDAARN